MRRTKMPEPTIHYLMIAWQQACNRIINETAAMLEEGNLPPTPEEFERAVKWNLKVRDDWHPKMEPDGEQ